MIWALLGAALASARAQDAGGHAAPPRAAASPEDERRALLEELWQRRILPPDLTVYSPKDKDQLERIRRWESEAKSYLTRRLGSDRGYVTRRPEAPITAPELLTAEGFNKFLALISQDAINFFAEKGVEAKWAFHLTDMAGKRIFSHGFLTDDGLIVYLRAKRNLEVYWKSENGETFGTRKPPAQ